MTPEGVMVMPPDGIRQGVIIPPRAPEKVL